MVPRRALRPVIRKELVMRFHSLEISAMPNVEPFVLPGDRVVKGQVVARVYFPEWQSKRRSGRVGGESVDIFAPVSGIVVRVYFSRENEPMADAAKGTIGPVLMVDEV
jgi:predicted deacylase